MHPVKLNKVVVSNCSAVEHVESRFPNEELGVNLYRTQDFLDMEFAFKYMECGNYEDMSKSMKPRLWRQYILDILVCLKQKIFFSYHALTTYFRGFENP